MTKLRPPEGTARHDSVSSVARIALLFTLPASVSRAYSSPSCGETSFFSGQLPLVLLGDHDDLDLGRLDAVVYVDLDHVGTHSLDGFFDMYLIPGSYSLSVTEWTSRSEGHKQIDSVQISALPGQNVRSLTFILDESGIPLPETDMPLLVLLVVVSLTVICQKRIATASTNSRSKSDGRGKFRRR